MSAVILDASAYVYWFGLGWKCSHPIHHMRGEASSVSG